NNNYKEEAAELGKLALGDRSHLAPSAFSLYGAGLLSESFPATDKVVQQALSESRKKLEEQDIDSYNFEASNRYRRINEIVKQSTSRVKAKPLLAQKIDPLLTHPVWGTIIFLAIMTIIFQSIFLWADLPMTFIDDSITSLGNLIEPLIPPGKIRSLIIEGILAGVGSVLIFIPQIAILFFFLGALEDSAYLTRAAFLMDRLMRHVGLQGRSFIPLLSSFACAIPGIMATRTIPSFADRMATILIAPLMSCAARLPVYTVLIAAFVPKTKLAGIFSLQGVALFSLYLLGIIGAAIVSFALKKTILRGEPSVFVMELPPFRRPSLRLVLHNVLDRIKIFVKDAGTVIFACSIILWALASYPQEDGHIANSYAGRIGHFIEPAIKPLGYNWEIGVGLIASFAAREVFISTLATIYSIEDQSEDNSSLVNSLAAKRERGEFSVATAISLLVFYVFACQCMATIAVVKRETSWRWATFMLAYMTLLAYGSAWSAYNLAIIMNLG
ncbi:MAG: ferrous iron transport protein B, partial [bacterium]|nr:ferrous iron transport protein B [bacterium]